MQFQYETRKQDLGDALFADDDAFAAAGRRLVAHDTLRFPAIRFPAVRQPLALHDDGERIRREAVWARVFSHSGIVRHRSGPCNGKHAQILDFPTVFSLPGGPWLWDN